MILLAFFGFAEALRSKLIITDDFITLEGAFRTRSLHFEDIKGYRNTDKTIILFPETRDKKKIEITTYFGRYYWIEQWITSYFVDLDLDDKADEEEQILQNEEFGATVEIREARFVLAKKTARVFNIIGTLSFAWTTFLPTPYAASVVLAMILPVIGMIVIYLFRGLIKLNEKNNSPYPTLAYGILLPVIGICLRAVLDFDLITDENIWVTSASAGVCLVMLLYYGSKELGFRKGEEIFMTIFSAVMFFWFSYSSYVITNCQFDLSQPKIFKSTVIEKSTSTGSMTTYYLILKPWGPKKDNDRVSVTKELYNAIQMNEQVNVFLKKGLLDTKWFYIEKESK
jgi:hypothetical protein